jgi:hypothetical protein
MSKVHILPDENLGGVLREYIEVDRKANVGDYVVIVNADNDAYRFGGYKNADFAKIHEFDNDSFGIYAQATLFNGRNAALYPHEYRTLEPADIVHIDNKRYRLINRKAKEGERVIIINNQAEGFDIGFIGTVFEVINDGDIVVINGCFGHYHGDYLVLESIEQQQFTDSQNKPDISDKLANLARRVTELEKRVVAIDEHNDVLIDRINDVEGKLNQTKTPYFKTFTPNIYFNIHTKEKSAEELANEIIRKLHEMIGKYTQ